MLFNAIRISGLSSATFPLRPASPNAPYFLKGESTGLGPVSMENTLINAASFGGYFQGSRKTLREIVLRVGLQPDYANGKTVEQVRSDLYWINETKANGHLRISIMNGGTEVAFARGYAKHMEPNPFSRDPEIVITLQCEDSTFQSPSMQEVSSPTPTLTTTPMGTARASLLVEARFTASSSSIGMHRFIDGRANPEEFLATTGFTFGDGDLVRIVSDSFDRRLELVRGGVTTNLMGFLAPSSSWPMFDPFVPNRLVVWGPENFGIYLQRVRYTPRWNGV